jgi:predicted nuclease of restriction endonuclease-like (RecB) superfamily
MMPGFAPPIDWLLVEMSTEITLYRELLGDIKTRVRQAQHKAMLSANAEMILMYWDIGRMIAARQEREGWGAGVIPRLAVDLKNELPEEKGFSDTNLKRMVQFSREYPTLFPIGARPVAKLPPLPELPPLRLPSGEIGARVVPQLETVAAQGPMVQRIVAQLSWGHNVILIQKLKHLPTRLWYARQTIEAEGLTGTAAMVLTMRG